MLKPRGLGRRVAQGPHSFPAFSDNSRQKTHQTKSVTFRFPCHCDLFSLVETDSGALSDNSRQNQAESGKFRQNQAISGKSGLFQAFSGIFRQNQAESGRIRQNQAKSGNPLDLENHWSGTYAVPRTTTAPPFWAEFFWVRSIKTKAQANYNQTASNGIILPKTWQLC